MENKLYIDLPPFTGRNVPITEIAKAMHKDAQYVRVGLQTGILKFGYALKLDNSTEFSYYCQKGMGRNRLFLSRGYITKKSLYPGR